MGKNVGMNWVGLFCCTPCISLWLEEKVDVDGEEERNQGAKRLCIA